MEKQPLCPQLLVWRRIYTALENAYRQAGDAGMPPPPYVLNVWTWERTTDLQKQQRWAETVAWAAEHGFGGLIPVLADGDLYDGE